ncbi:regulator of G-protein signaling 5-like isoform X2 [Syngnathoides biaculeatus]|uniref:regulator of G-protein signaling 5-like isoform X2 n=1 Tax=Syngnathoides biaculeatus TaxID=300417 RepID=UPI002ADD9283|nr:regulator of G-protein signaling 5-like isoform X2 [Syngnathoides biaculeatus]
MEIEAGERDGGVWHSSTKPSLREPQSRRTSRVFADTQIADFLLRIFNHGPTQERLTPDHLESATMCKGLALMPTCCLERAKELKASLGTLLQKSEWNLFCCKMGKNKPTLEECLRWKGSFEQLLSSKYGLCAFTAFLLSEYSEENIAFYFACEDYRSTKSLAKLPTKAQKIYNEFIGSDAPREINIDHETRDITKANMHSPSPYCFDQAQHKIYMLMAKDCYPRFLRSPAFRDIISQAKPSTKPTKQPQLGKKV